MGKKSIFCVVWLFCFIGSVFSTSVRGEALVSNTEARLRPDGSRFVDIHYDLSGGREPVTVAVWFSDDNGQSWDIIPRGGRLSGDYGPSITNGKNKRIVWDAAGQWHQMQWDKFKAKVVAAESPDGKTVAIPLPGGVILEMVPIPPGSFKMGSPDDERGRSKDEGPLHEVNINYSFYMGKYEVTQAQWESLMDRKPHRLYGIGKNHPTFYISWYHCLNYISSLNRLDLGYFRLPSEAEWEYACRAGTQTRFYFGDSMGCNDYCDDCKAGKMSGNRGDYMWYCGNNVREGKPQFGCKPVGQKKPNAFGLYDMSGNLWEWCQDEYHHSYKGAPTDGSAWQSDEGGHRVLRGGAWDYRAAYCRSACRCGYRARSGYTFHGFRLVWQPYSKGSMEWFDSWPAVEKAENMVSYQSQWGGWPKRMHYALHEDQGEKFTRNWGSTIDNGRTYTELNFLAKAYYATRKKEFKKSFLQGVDYLLEAQYDHGGWPQRYPLDKVGNDYGDYVTYNDDAMIGVMRLMQNIAEGKREFSFVDEEYRKKAKEAFRKGLDCILKTQIVIDGQRTIWAQQYDEKTLAPAAARAFEPVALCSRESVSIVEFLMEFDHDAHRDDEIIQAVQSAVKWLDEHKATVRKVGDKYVHDPNARPRWARFYEIESRKAIFAGIDSEVKYDLSKVGKTTGYSYRGSYAEMLLVRDYPAWQKKMGVENVLEKPETTAEKEK